MGINDGIVMVMVVMLVRAVYILNMLGFCGPLADLAYNCMSSEKMANSDVLSSLIFHE